MKARPTLLIAVLAIAAAVACESRLELSRQPSRPEQVASIAERSSMRLVWHPVPDARSYVVYVGREPGVSAAFHLRAFETLVPAVLVTNLAPGTTYYAAVVAVTEDGESDLSPEVAARPLEDDRLRTGASWSYEGESGSRLGAAIGIVGDLDLDGRDDVLVGSPATVTEGGAASGAVRMFLGTFGGLARDPSWRIRGPGETFIDPLEGREAGTTLGAIPDLDADGRPELFLGAPGTFKESGRAYLYLGSDADPPALSTVYAFDTAVRLAATGVAIANIDTAATRGIVVGAPAPASATYAGRVQLYRVGSLGVSYPEVWQYESGEIGDRLGTSVAAGDVDGDGREDLLVGAPGASGGAGRVHLFRSAPGGAFPPMPSWTFTGGAGDALGSSVAIGDLNCDGFGDLIAGAPGADVLVDAVVASNAGAAYVWLGGPGAPGSQPWDVIEGTQENEGLAVVAAAGDLTGDGCEDLLVGSPGYDGIFTDEGRAIAVAGSAGGLGALFWSDGGLDPGAALGSALAGRGDVDGDSFPDVLVGAPLFQTRGQVRLYRSSAPSGPHARAGLPIRATAGVPASPVLAGFSDPAARQRHRCTWSWGDGTSTTIEPCAPHAAAASHRWESPGRYEVKLTVERQDGIFGESVTTAIVEAPR